MPPSAYHTATRHPLLLAIWMIPAARTCPGQRCARVVWRHRRCVWWHGHSGAIVAIVVVVAADVASPLLVRALCRVAVIASGGMCTGCVCGVVPLTWHCRRRCVIASDGTGTVVPLCHGRRHHCCARPIVSSLLYAPCGVVVASGGTGWCDRRAAVVTVAGHVVVVVERERAFFFFLSSFVE
ncbi:hypothetical protein HD554DRAFT_2125384 [Boletus coccyginus]|nr:hypothetical protein HD554DRAFT_2125384 [Boletus coccyginus]